jgi:HPt (histidine-containing phosphotransfer) domain-containing protein
MSNVLLDLQRLEMIGGLDDPEVLMLVEEFIEGIPDYLNRIESALSPFEPIQLREGAHSIRGVGGMLGFQLLSAAAAEGDLPTPPLDPREWFDRLTRLCADSVSEWQRIRPGASGNP